MDKYATPSGSIAPDTHRSEMEEEMGRIGLKAALNRVKDKVASLEVTLTPTLILILWTLPMLAELEPLLDPDHCRR